jgi:hypothetical protein
MWDSLSTEEVVATLRAADALEGVAWAGPLLADTAESVANLRERLKDRSAGRPVEPGERGFFFELRYAETLHLYGLTAEYEFKAGVGDTSVDFRVDQDPPWLIELLSLRQSAAVRAATQSDGIFSSLSLNSPPRDANRDQQTQSPEGELIKAQQRVGEKAFRGGQPIKFPEPSAALHMIMTDARAYSGIGGDEIDWVQLALGAAPLPEHSVLMWPNPTTGQHEPIAGLFEARCPGRASATVRERVHVLGFVCEETFEAGEIAEKTIYIKNPALTAELDVQKALASWPLQPKQRSVG